MAKPKVESSVSRANKFEGVLDIKTIGKGRQGLRDLFAPKTNAHSPILAQCDVRSKDFGAIF